MKINRENYEAYFIDYLEGNLDELLVNDFIEFLQNNPDLKEELSLLELVSLEPEDFSFNKKVNLYKVKFDSEKEFNTKAVASLEGDISESDKTEFESYLTTHPEKKKDIALFAKTKLQADESVIFNKKNKLYHRSFGRTIFLWSVRVAAILVLALTFYILVDKSGNKIVPTNNMVKLEDKKEKKAEIPILINKSTEESQKKDTAIIKKATTKSPVKKVDPKHKPRKSLRESNEGRMNHEDLVMNRIPVEVPAELNSITASLNIQQTKTDLAVMYISVPEEYYVYGDERLFVDVVKEKTGINKFKFNKITKAGLNLVSNISKEKFKYKTNNEGKIIEYNYDSRLLAFSIPANKADTE